jgi:hypothetical protein
VGEPGADGIDSACRAEPQLVPAMVTPEPEMGEDGEAFYDGATRSA